MSTRNFVPTVWEAQADKALDEWLIAANFCNQQYTGSVEKAGDQIRVQQAVRPTIHTSTDGKPITLSTAERVDDTSLTMTLLHQVWYNFEIPDIDKAQAEGNLKEIFLDEAIQGNANQIDIDIFKCANDPAVKKTSSTEITKDNILGAINKGYEELFKNNVPPNSEIEVSITPAFHTVFLEAYEKLDTNNSEMLKQGIVGKYGPGTIKMSNNIYNNGTDDFITMRTKKAIAFAKPLTKMYATDATSNSAGFGDILKGFTLYEAKVMRPKEIYVIKAHV